MKESPIRVTLLQDLGDERGSSFSVVAKQIEFLGSVLDIHIAMLRPGHLRGNHYHSEHREVIVIIYRDRWSLYWDTGADTQIQQRQFNGNGAVLIEIDQLASHAIKNEGLEDLYVFGLSNKQYDAQKPDTHHRPIVQI
ncbi:MAG: hypothetical protein AB1597_05750 [Chloroflexota bacterium]